MKELIARINAVLRRTEIPNDTSKKLTFDKRGFPDLGADGPAVHDGQHDVQQNQIRSGLLELLNGPPAVPGDADIKALLHQVHVDEIAGH